MNIFEATTAEEVRSELHNHKINHLMKKLNCSQKDSSLSKLIDAVKVGDSRSEKLWNLINIRPKCLGCENNTTFNTFGDGYSRFCGTLCSSNHISTLEKRKNTSIKKYGFEYAHLNPTVRNKIDDTMMTRYGVTIPAKNKQLTQKRTDTIIFYCDIITLHIQIGANVNKLSSTFKTSFQKKFASNTEMPVLDYLDLCKTDKMAYANVAERMLAAIGPAKIVDTSTDSRLSRIFSNKKMRVYDTFKDFYGIEESVERIVSYFNSFAQGLEESRQVIYLKGPVGSAKSSLAERLKELAQVHPIYVLKDSSEKDLDLQISPLYESPLGLFNKIEHGEEISNVYGIDPRYLNTIPSGWAQEKLKEFGGDWTRFSVVRIYPNKEAQIGIMKVEPGDENNQDASVLIGKTDIRKIEKLSQNHPYAYSYSGGLNRTSQGILEYCEMFKAQIKTLNPLLEATQSHSYKGTENIPAMPYTGVICAHSNEAEWFKFRNDKSNEAFLDRVYIVNVPYCLRVTEEQQIYNKMIGSSSLKDAPCAPETLKSLAEFMVLTRLRDPANSTIFAKMKVYNGENVKDTMPMAKPLEEYKDAAGVDEGMTGLSTRFGFKILSQTYNLHPEETQANPIDLMYVIETALKREHLPQELHDQYLDFVKTWVHPRYFEFLDKELRIAYLESYSDFGQTMFERYFLFAEAWIEETTVRDPETHTLLNRDHLNTRLESIEKSAQIVNAKDFRNDIVHYVLRYRSRNGGKMPAWNEYEKIKIVIEKKMFAATEEIMPIVSFAPKGSSEEQKKHDNFVARMRTKGYTDRTIRTCVEWWSANRKTG
jgi:serine protein kinase